MEPFRSRVEDDLAPEDDDTNPSVHLPQSLVTPFHRRPAKQLHWCLIHFFPTESYSTNVESGIGLDERQRVVALQVKL